jgi:hypothetical protein
LQLKIKDRLYDELIAEGSQHRMTETMAGEMVAGFNAVEEDSDLAAMQEKLFNDNPAARSMWAASLESLVRGLDNGPGKTGMRWISSDSVGLVDESVLRGMIQIYDTCGAKGIKELRASSLVSTPCKDTIASYRAGSVPEERITAKTVEQTFRAADTYDSYRSFLDAESGYQELEAEGAAARAGAAYTYDGPSPQSRLIKIVGHVRLPQKCIVRE